MTADPIVHELPMRWADLDLLNHVNNVVYLDYAAESRALLADDGVVARDDEARRIGVDFLKPLLLSSRPVEISSTVGDAAITQEIRSQGSETVFARVATSFGQRQPIPLVPQAGRRPARTRRSDLDESGVVSTTKVFELFQEARVLCLSRSLTEMQPGRFVVGRTEVMFAGPIVWRADPYEASSWVSRIGSSSVTIESQLLDGDHVLAQCSTVLVGFDLETQRSRTLSDAERRDLVTLTPQH